MLGQKIPTKFISIKKSDLKIVLIDLNLGWHTCTRIATWMSITAALYFKMLVMVGGGIHHHTGILFLLDCANHHDILTELSAWVEQSWVLCSLCYGVTESIVRCGPTGTQAIKQ
jgi:hypothetical protein